jgi:hypothetical protein
MLHVSRSINPARSRFEKLGQMLLSGERFRVVIFNLGRACNLYTSFFITQWLQFDYASNAETSKVSVVIDFSIEKARKRKYAAKLANDLATERPILPYDTSPGFSFLFFQRLWQKKVMMVQ